MLHKLDYPLRKFNIPLAKNVLKPLATMTSASATDGAIPRKMQVQEIIRVGKGKNLVILNE